MEYTSTIDVKVYNLECQAVSTGENKNENCSHSILPYTPENKQVISLDTSDDVSGGKVPAHPVKSPASGSETTYYQSISVDWEFNTGFKINQPTPTTISEYRKVLGESFPVVAGYQTKTSADKLDIKFSQPTANTSQVLLIESPINRYNLIESWEGETLITHALGLKEVPKPEKTNKVMQHLVKFVFFYSDLDLLFSFKSLSIQLNIIRQLVRHRTLKVNPDLAIPALKTGVYVLIDGKVKELTLDVKDQAGKGVGGLDKQCAALGVELTAKAFMNDWKDDMGTAYESIYPSCSLLWKGLKQGQTEPKTKRIVEFDKGEILHDWCCVYTKGDVNANFQIDYLTHQKMTKASKLLGLDYPVKPFNTVASVTSRLVVDLIAKTLEDGQEIFFDGEGLTQEGRNLLGQILLPQSGYAISEYGGNVATLLTTDGGYCKHMTPRLMRILSGSLVLDIDLKGCYMEGMACQPYPVGRPIIGAFKYKEERPTLRAWLAATRHELEPNCWEIRLSNRVLEEVNKGKKTVYSRYQLTFEQDLILSKHFDSKVSGDFEDENDEDGLYQVDDFSDGNTNKADFQLNTREITYGLIDHDIFQAMECYWKPSELKEVLDNCVVDAYWYYPKSQLTDYGTFLSRFKLETSPNYPHNNTWCIVPMKGIAQPFIDLRAKEKTASKVAYSLAKGEKVKENDKTVFMDFHGDKEWDYFVNLPPENLKAIAVDHDAGQYTFKITGLTIYGSAGSFHYQTELGKTTKVKGGWIETFNPKHGHYLVANHITARARLAVWCMSKVLFTSVVITDGGFFNINSTRVWDWEGRNRKRVGANELSRMTNHELTAKELHNHELNIKIVPLGGWGNWRVDGITTHIDKTKSLHLVNEFTPVAPVTVKNEDLGQLDANAFEQVATQFSKLDIFSKKQVRFASKDLYGGAAIHSQSNYILEPIEFEGEFYGQENIKWRGQKVNGKAYKSPHIRDYEHTYEVHPCVTFMRQLLKDPSKVELFYEFYTDYLLSVNQFNERDKKGKNDEINNDYADRGFLPGSQMSKRSFIKLVSLSTFRWQTRSQFETWKSRNEKMKDKTGVGLEGFFINSDGTFDYERAIKVIQDCIDDGMNWVNSLRVGYEHGVIHPQHYIWADMFPCQAHTFLPDRTGIKDK